MTETYVIRTSRGANILSFDNLARAVAEKAAHQKRIGVDLHIVRQRIVEERVG